MYDGHVKGTGVWIALLGLGLAGCGPAWEWVDPEDTVPGRWDMASGTTFQEALQPMAGEWWQWFVRVPGGDDHPVHGGDCTQGQDPDSDIWFLAGNYFLDEPEHRECTIPKGKYILVPMHTTVSFCFWQPCATWADCDEATCEDQQGMHDDWPEVEFPLTLSLEWDDGEESAPLTEAEVHSRYRAQAECFELIPPTGGERTDIYDSDSDCDFAQPWAEGNPCDQIVGENKVASGAGYFPMARPPHRGEYELQFTADNPDGDMIDITYALTID